MTSSFRQCFLQLHIAIRVHDVLTRFLYPVLKHVIDVREPLQQTLTAFQRCIKWRATSRAAVPTTTAPMSCHGIRGVVLRLTRSAKNQTKTLVKLMFIGPCIIAIVDDWKTNLMSLAILFHLLCAQHVSDINISIFRSLRLCWWIATSVVLFSVRCVLELLLWLVFGGVRFAGWSLQT